MGRLTLEYVWSSSCLPKTKNEQGKIIGVSMILCSLIEKLKRLFKYTEANKTSLMLKQKFSLNIDNLKIKWSLNFQCIINGVGCKCSCYEHTCNYGKIRENTSLSLNMLY